MQTVDGRPTLAASPAFIDIVNAVDPDAVLLSFLGGNEHSVLSLRNPAAPFDFVWPADSDAPLRPGPAHRARGTAAAEGQRGALRDTPEVFGDLIARHGLMPISIRLKYDGLYVELLRRHLTPLRIECLGPPPASLDAHGALLDTLTLGCTHGNEAYGALVLQQLRDLA